MSSIKGNLNPFFSYFLLHARNGSKKLPHLERHEWFIDPHKAPATKLHDIKKKISFFFAAAFFFLPSRSIAIHFFHVSRSPEMSGRKFQVGIGSLHVRHNQEWIIAFSGKGFMFHMVGCVVFLD